MNSSRRLLSALRIVLGWYFLWAFLDKVFGLGFATGADKSWLAGASPTAGFFKFAARGPLAEFYQGLIGSVIVDWLFMLGLLFLGLALILGIAMRLAGYLGALLMLLMYGALLPPEHNPVVDEHIIYALLFLLLGHSEAGETMGLGKWWRGTRLVKRWPFLI